MKSKIISYAFIFLFFFSTGIAYGQKKKKERPVVNIGVVIDGPWHSNESIRQLFEQEILTLARDEFDVRFPESRRIVADHTAARVKSALDRLLDDPEINLILALGPIASNDACHRGDLPKPVVAPFIINAAVQNLPLKDGATGVKNLSCITFPSDIPRDLEVFHELAAFNKITVLLSSAVYEAIPKLADNIKTQIQSLGLTTTIVPVATSAEEALPAIPADAEAVYIAPLLRMSSTEFQRLVNGLIERKLPSFSLLGRSEVELGVFASLAPSFNFNRLARRVGLYVQKILLGEEPGALPVAFTRREQLTVNMATARAIRVFPRWSVITDAELLHEEPQEVQRQLTIASAVKEAVAVNLDLAAIEREVNAGAQNVNIARSVLLPQIEASATGVVIDKDRAESSFGSQAERTWSGNATLSQVIYSEPAWANLSIQRHLQTALEKDRDQLRLNVTRDAALAYLNVLRGKTFERIQKNNLQWTRSNLELAQMRESIGYSGRADVFRWESEMALDRIDVIDAEAQRRQAEIALNRLLHRPLEEPFLTAETGLDDPALLTSDPRLFEYTNNLWYFQIFRDFMAQEGFNASPELQQLEAAIAAQERAYASATRAFWSPTIALQGEATNVFSRSGAGSKGVSFNLPPGFPNLSFPQPKDLSWNVALRFSIPIFNGAERFARKTQANESLRQLRLQRQAVAERIELGIRAGLHATSASYPAIRLTREAADAAQKNLDLVIDAYSRGVVNIIQLLDAQNAAFIARLRAENAVYDFLSDFMEVQRGIGTFDIFMSAEEREEWFKRLEEYFTKAGVTPIRR